LMAYPSIFETGHQPIKFDKHRGLRGSGSEDQGQRES
jgi:hypothetical protein